MECRAAISAPALPLQKRYLLVASDFSHADTVVLRRAELSQLLQLFYIRRTKLGPSVNADYLCPDARGGMEANKPIVHRHQLHLTRQYFEHCRLIADIALTNSIKSMKRIYGDLLTLLPLLVFLLLILQFEKTIWNLKNLPSGAQRVAQHRTDTQISLIARVMIRSGEAIHGGKRTNIGLATSGTSIIYVR